MTPALADALPRLVRLAREDPMARDVYLVGGWVRDTLLGRTVHEIDITAADAPAFAARCAEVLGTRVVPLGGPHPLFRVPLEDGHIDVSPRQGTLAEDLARRDFTVNAMAVALGDLPDAPTAADLRPSLVDPHGGLADLDARVLRAVSAHAFEDDPLRAWRAARFTASLGFAVDAETRRLVAGIVPRMHEQAPAPERVSAELTRLFEAPRAIEGVRLMEDTGLLEHTFPELAEGYDVEQRPWHTYNVYRHQLVAFERVDTLLSPSLPADSDDRALWEHFWHDTTWADTRWGPLRTVLDRHRAAIRVATLLHDVGKPRTLTLESDGRTRFFGHSEVGADMVTERLRAWRFPTAFIEHVALLIEQHLRPGQVTSPGEPPTDRALHRFHEALGEATPDLCVLFLADSLATAPEQVRSRWPAYVGHIQRIIEWRPARSEQSRRLVDGHEVMRATGIAPGPALGRVMAALDEATAVGDVRTPEEALRIAADLVRESSEHEAARAD